MLAPMNAYLLTSTGPGRIQPLTMALAMITGPVIDAGCEPGHWTNFLHECDIAIEGADLVPEFIATAKQRFPDIRFRIGDLNNLLVQDGALGAILSWFSVIHTDPAHVPAQLAEFARCIRPGGSLLSGFFTGETVAPSAMPSLRPTTGRRTRCGRS